jgi:hypothetical protein
MEYTKPYEGAYSELTGRLGTVTAMKEYIAAGNATFTLRNGRTGVRYTYKTKLIEENGTSYYVSLLTGPDNEGDFTYLGLMKTAQWAHLQFVLTKKSKMTADSIPVRAVEFLIRCINRQEVPPSFEFWHEGRCGRCGRKLTVPESVDRGFGPECASMIGRAA